MAQSANIMIPSQEESDRFKSSMKRERKGIFKPSCERFCLISVFLVLLIWIVLKVNKVEEKAYVQLCQVYDCTGQAKAVGAKNQSQMIEGHKKKDTLKSKSNLWQIQKIVWLYKSQLKINSTKESQLFEKLNNQNTRHLANSSGYQIRQFGLSTFSRFLTQGSVAKIHQIQAFLKSQKHSSSISRQKVEEIIKNQQLIIKRFIIYFLLLQNGGVFMDSEITLVEPFETWLEKITSVPFINIGEKLNQSVIKPRCFGFFDNDYSSLRLKVNVMREYDFERKMVVFPALEQGFLACQNGSSFLEKLIEAYEQVLTLENLSQKLRLLNKNEDLIGKTNPQLLFQDGHILASHIVLQERQGELLQMQQLLAESKNLSMKQSYTPLAIDQFGLVSINNNIGPHKFKHIFLYQEKCYSYLTKLSIPEMVKTMGKLRFVAKLTQFVRWKLAKHIFQGSTPQLYFAKGSFMHSFFLKFLPTNQKQLQSQFGLSKIPEIINLDRDPQQNLGNPLWSALPNTLWVFWDKGIHRHSKPIIELCYANLKRSAQASNFSIKVVSNQNLEQYISKQLRDRIHQTVKNARQHVSSQTMSDFWRLAVMYQNGGVYVDASTFTTGQNLDFIRNVTRAPSNMLWNRYGSEPQVFVFFNSLLGSPADWHYDFKRNTKVQWHLSYESNFIAAVKKSEFVKEWLDVFMEWMTLPYSQIFKQMSHVGMQDSKWTKTNDRYLLVMDAVKYVAGRREKMIGDSEIKAYESAADYYKIWSLSGQSIGQQKFRGEYNFESRDYRLDYMEVEILNLYKTEYRWEFGEELLGSFEYQTKFFGLDLRESGFLWDNFYWENGGELSLERFEDIIHPESVFGKLLLYRDRELTKNLMKYYNQQSVVRLQLKASKMSGF